MAFEIKRNDLLPRYRIQLTQSDPDTGEQSPVDFTAATGAVFIMKLGGAVKIDREPMTFVDRVAGIVEYEWVLGDTDTSGGYSVEIEVDWSGKPQTFPSTGYFSVVIGEDLG